MGNPGCGGRGVGVAVMEVVVVWGFWWAWWGGVVRRQVVVRGRWAVGVVMAVPGAAGSDGGSGDRWDSGAGGVASQRCWGGMVSGKGGAGGVGGREWWVGCFCW